MTKLTQVNYPMLPTKDNGFINKIKNELNDTMSKRQMFRTETEMRFSVLNDGKHPTKASKYWQSVREQGVFIENLHTLSFEYRRNLVKLKRKQQKLETETEYWEDIPTELFELIKNNIKNGNFDYTMAKGHLWLKMEISLES